jgi:serine/threonine protein kinase
MLVGKWLYMSPETTASQQVDHRSDLFSLGVILYLLCSGYMPFTGSEPREIVQKIRAGQYRPLREILAVPERLEQLIARMLAPNPDDRPQTGQEVAAELTEIARQYGIESSAPHIAYALQQLFPPGAADAELQGTAQLLTEDRSSVTGRDRSPGSVTEGSISSSRRLPVDVSQTYQQQPNIDALGATQRAAMPVIAAPGGAALPRVASYHGLGVRRRRGWVLVAVIVAVAIALIGYALGTR